VSAASEPPIGPEADRRQVIRDYAGHIRVAARRLVPASQVDEAYQVGVMGLLVAFEFYRPSRGAPWGFAARFVREAIQVWCEVEADGELLRGLSDFAAGLSPEDRALLFSEDGRRPSGQVIPFRRP
jgi:hypothetical protein